MVESRKHRLVALFGVICILGIIGVLSCAIFQIVKLGDIAKATNPNTWRYIFAGWVHSMNGDAGADVGPMVVEAVFEGIGFVLAVLTLIFGIRARRFVGIWYFFELAAAFGFAGLGLSVASTLSALKELPSTESKHYAAVGFMFLGGAFLLLFAILQFVFFMLECHECRKQLLELKAQEAAKAPKEEAKPVEEKKAEPVKAEPAPKAPVVEEKKEEVKAEPVKEEKKEEAKPVEEAKEEPKKEEKKPEEKKAPAKKAEKKAPAKKAEDKGEAKNKVYHISQHPTSDKWQVKLAKGEKALKLFDTQAEAIAYAKEVAGNQEGSIRVHSREGKIRKA